MGGVGEFGSAIRCGGVGRLSNAGDVRKTGGMRRQRRQGALVGVREKLEASAKIGIIGPLPAASEHGSIGVGGWRGQHWQRRQRVSKNGGAGVGMGDCVRRRWSSVLARTGAWATALAWEALERLAAH